MRALRVVLVLMDTLLFAFPAYAYGPAWLTNPVHDSLLMERVTMGDFIDRQVLYCFRKKDLYFVTDPKTSMSLRARKLFGYPYRCGITEVNAYLWRLDRKFIGIDGAEYWTIGVGNESGEVLFYIVLPASALK